MHFLLQVSTGSVFVWIGLAVAALFVVMIAFQVENIGRDFITNESETAADAKDARLRPIETELPLEEVADLVEQQVRGMSRWKAIDRDESDDITALNLTHSTQFLHFTDDVTVYLERLPNGGTRLHAHSGSRMGIGDLGQNPRNLRELLGPLRQRMLDVEC